MACGSHTVKAPASTLMKEGYDFAGWRGFQGTAPNKTEKIYNAGESISVRENPAKKGFAFDGWTVSRSVTEDGSFFAKGSAFDLNTKITTDLELTAQWKHVHSYSCYRISDFGSQLAEYQKYETILHIAVCSCGDIDLVAHEFDSNGKCACGYRKPAPGKVSLEVSYGQWTKSGGTYSEKMQGLSESFEQDQQVFKYAPNTWGSLKFYKWQYSTDGGSTWKDSLASPAVSFSIPCSMKLRALYINDTIKPQVELSARNYLDTAEYKGKTVNMDNILFHMNYKLPDGYTFVDAGIRLGDNAGISYYELKERTIEFDNEAKAIATGLVVVTSILSQSVNTFDSSETETYYAERENSVPDEMNAETLAKYMYESKPVNVEKYDPIYWEAKAVTKGMSGSMATIPPLRFAQKNNQNHYIYGIGWLRYKDTAGKIQTIYTDALPATVNRIPGSAVTKSGS